MTTQQTVLKQVGAPASPCSRRLASLALSATVAATAAGSIGTAPGPGLPKVPTGKLLSPPGVEEVAANVGRSARAILDTPLG